MITQIRIDGFKSFVGFELDVHPVTVLLGVNGAGKSNLFDALRLVAGTVRRGFKETLAADRRLAARDLFHRNGTGALRDEFTIAVRMTVPLSSPRVVEVQLSALRNGSGSAILDQDGSWVRILDSAGRPGERVPLTEVQDTRNRFAHGTIERTDVAEAAFWLLAECATWQPYTLEPDALRELGRPEADGPLEPRGSNLATVVNRIEAAAPDRFIRLVADLAALVPGVRGIRTEVLRTRGEFDFEVEFQYTGWVSPASLSDGTLRALALLAAHWDRGRGLLAVEEIENGMHLSQVAELVRRLGRGEGQLLATTHSSALLTALRNDLSGSVVFLEQANHVDPGRGTISRITVPLPLLPHTPDTEPGTVKSPEAVERLLHGLGRGAR
ncbi:AAA family ATPase [Kitasatospora sp. YST-16]|uniref:AAA family ATPase n=1 Tax=Kitasatospora sp. YST-16 TaxID=2998080 RepID=UPI00228493DD|nr:ATP-binding protein [Kitasatospora sp. YST-16]WAL73942.1 AAA family ATPase [Kitasatospora sp. YST-16]WNW40017.1 AAA family ATPase [Streptomyces sp. Li-HN-5-13]